ncbi:MAG: hypothetical protein IJQ43_07345 [Oscillospiraceae bacterium]|nr:hypothetical protein [Oscillospiraceae bacterium]
MKRVSWICLALLLILALTLPLSGCGKAAAPAAQPEDSAAQEEAPVEEGPKELHFGTLTVSSNVESLDLSGAGSSLEELMRASNELKNVREISLGARGETLEQLRAVEKAFPQAKVSWKAQILGEEIDCSAESVDLSAAADGDVPQILPALAILPELKTLTLAPEDGVTTLSFDSLSKLAAAFPEAELNCRFELFGQTADWTTEKLKYKKIAIGNEGIELFREALPYLRALDLLRIEDCGITDYDAMDALRAEYPDKRVVWSVIISGHVYMTDTTLINDGDTGILNDDNVYLLQYMHDVLYLDLGHYGHISNIEFVRNFPKLQVLITTLSKVGDLTPLEDCPDLEFLECHGTPVGDISVLADKYKLEYLNISNLPNLKDLSPLYGLKQLKIVRICGSTFTQITREDVERLKQELPDTFVSDYGGDPNSSGQWRFTVNGDKSKPTERYKLLREQMLYDLPMWERISNSPSKEE